MRANKPNLRKETEREQQQRNDTWPMRRCTMTFPSRTQAEITSVKNRSLKEHLLSSKSLESKHVRLMMHRNGKGYHMHAVLPRRHQSIENAHAWPVKQHTCEKNNTVWHVWKSEAIGTEYLSRRASQPSY